MKTIFPRSDYLEITSADYLKIAEQWPLLPEEADLINPQALNKRRLEFTMGRALCHQLILKRTGQIYPILRGSYREPLWPSGIVGSISHTSWGGTTDILASSVSKKNKQNSYNTTVAGVLIASSNDYLGLGLDLQQIAPVRSDLADHIAQNEELIWIHQTPEQAQLRTLQLFSIKEALYKALFPVIAEFISIDETTNQPLRHGLKSKKTIGFKDVVIHFSSSKEIQLSWQENFLNKIDSHYTLPQKLSYFQTTNGTFILSAVALEHLSRAQLSEDLK